MLGLAANGFLSDGGTEVDLLGMLENNLQFLKMFYDKACRPFFEQNARIESHDPPYDDFDHETEEPPFLSEWIENQTALNLLGEVSLAILQVFFKDHLQAFIKHSGKSLPNEKGNWFEKCKKFFLSEYGIDWTKSGADLALLEQVSLARNSIIHTRNTFDAHSSQSNDYFRRFPNATFVNNLEQSLYPNMIAQGINPELRIEVTKEKLSLAVEAVQSFCQYLENSGQ